MKAPRVSAGSPDRTLADIVTADARSADVFERFGLDYCCHGRRTIEEAASARGVKVADVVAALNDLGTAAPDDAEDWSEVDLDRLTEHIIVRHHSYVREAGPRISAWLDKLATRHGDRHPELDRVRRTFGALQDELMTHMVKEENVLFPFVDDLARAQRDGKTSPAGPFGTIRNPIRVMESDHALVGELMERLRSLTGEYVAPQDACATYRLCYQELAAFERDLHTHVHLENNVLFPRAVELESRMA